MLERYLEYLRYELNRAPLTVIAYRKDITQFLDWLKEKSDEEIDITMVTPGDVRAWLASLSKEGDTPRTLRRKLISLRSLFKWLQKRGEIDRSPLQDVALPKIPKPLPDFIKPEEVEQAIDEAKSECGDNELEGLLRSLIVEMLYSLGIRKAELVSLDDSDVSFHTGEIRVTGKRSKQRVIPVPQKLLNNIKKWQAIRDFEYGNPEGESPLFVVKGKRITPIYVYRTVHKALGGSTARKKSPHALRHTFASGMLNGGAEIDSVREFLGHASLATTQIYTHISLNEIKKAYNSAHPRSERED